jgi:hypothetical protein
MRRHILFFAILFAFATSAQAQATGSDCSQSNQPTKTWNQNPLDPLCGGGYVGPHPFTVLSTTVDSCINLNTGSQYDGAVRQVTGNGVWQCYSALTPDLKCNPRIEQQVTHATSGTDYNRFYLRAWDINPGYLYACTEFPGMARQDFWQCKGVTCPLNHCTCRDCGCGSPIIIDVGGRGFELTDVQGGVKFDLAGTGMPEQMGWTAAGADNAFLALPGADGLIHNGSQLFGNFTPQPTSATPNGFAALAVFDDPKNGGNGDGVIDAKDAVFASLRLWIDANHDGISQPEELHTLPSLGVNSISLTYKLDQRTDQWGNKFQYRAQVNPGDPASVGRQAYDVFFIGLPGTAKNIPAGKCEAPTNKVGMLAPVSGSLR